MINIFDIFEKQPWKEYEPIYQLIKRNIDESGKLNDPYLTLPDESRNQDKGIKFAVGAMDGIMAHHFGGNSDKIGQIEYLISLLTKQLKRPSKRNRINLYNGLKEINTLSIIDDLLSELQKTEPDVNSLYNEVRWLAFNSAHRNVIKFSIALLGRFNTDDDDALLALGKHEEFTLFTTVALLNKNQDPMKKLVELAKCVRGWGKIHVVERILPESDEIKRWLITDGCENAIMNEYLAYTCAVNGDLINYIRKPQIDYEVYRGAGRIIKALIIGGPASDINDYKYGVEAIKRYVDHAAYMDNKLEDVIVLGVIKDYLCEQDDEQYEKLFSLGWDESSLKESIQRINGLLSVDMWSEQIFQDIKTTKDNRKYIAIRAANVLGIDIWDKLFNLLSDKSNDRMIYLELMRTEDIDRIKKLCQFARDQLDFTKVIGIPEDSMFGYEPDSDCLDSILQALDRFEGVGCELVSIGLQAKSIRNRNMAIKALEKWDKEYWPQDGIQWLKRLKNNEPNNDTLQRVNRLLE